MSLVSYLHLPADQRPQRLEMTGPFRAVIVVEQSTDAVWRNVVSDWLVESGCLYAVCWGRDCVVWEDSVDWASVAFSGEGASDDRFVMTTSHPDETLAEAFWFAATCAFYPTKALDQTLIIHVARDERQIMIEEYCMAREGAE
ncbi:MAG: hypothetical protein ACK4Y4_09105 [Brevundimonas sp.]